MSNNQIKPQTVTKPIQLLAAWLAGLIATNGSFLGAAVLLDNGQWERSALIMAAIANVPIFLIALFILQTRFRAELQEDSFYFEYISRKSNEVINLTKGIQESSINSELKEQGEVVRLPVESTTQNSELDWSRWKIALNDYRDDFHEIRASLEKSGIPVTVVFGKISGSTRPENWIIAISSRIEFEHVSELLRVLVKFDFDGFHRWRPIREAGELEDVYIGSYGEKDYVRITDELRNMLNSKMDEIDFQYYISKNARKQSA